MLKQFSIVSPYYSVLMATSILSELQSVTMIQQAISCSARLAIMPPIICALPRPSSSKSGEKLSPSHPNYSTQRFIMLENKSAERRISLYIECALNGIVSSGVGTLLQGESSDEHNYNRSSNASGSSGGTSYLGHLGLFLPGAEQPSESVSEASSYSHRCLVFCRDVYRRNGASPLLLFKIKQSAELIYGSLFDQSSKYSLYEDLKCLGANLLGE